MGKGTELWDDSVLINAFDSAMKSYKEMHTDGRDNKETDTVLTEEAKSERHIESEGNNFDVENNTEEPCMPSCNNAAATDCSFTRENDSGANFSVPEFTPPLASEHPSVNEKFDGYYDQINFNHNELLKQYHEVEARKEKILEQLWQANYWNFQTQVQSLTTQQQPVSVSSGSELVPITSCPWCTCQCPMASAQSMGYACCLQQVLHCYGSQVQQEAGEKKNGEINYSGKELLSTSQKTDLTSVINAWYWAGYHTGRYLLEQEQSDKLNKSVVGEQQSTVSKEKDGCS